MDWTQINNSQTQTKPKVFIYLYSMYNSGRACDIINYPTFIFIQWTEKKNISTAHNSIKKNALLEKNIYILIYNCISWKIIIHI